MLDTLCQTTRKTRTQPHPLAERLLKIIIRSQTPQNIPPDAVLPTRKTRSSLIHQNTVPSNRKHTQPTEPTLATGGRHQKQQEVLTCSLQKGDPKHSKLSKMRRQRNTQHMKEQGRNSPDQTNEEEIGSLPEKEFRLMIVKMIPNLANRMEKIQEMFTKDPEKLKSKQTVMNTTINEIKNSLEGINTRITEAEEWISDLEDKIVEITTAEQNKEKRMKRIEDSLRDLWNNIKCTNIRIIGVPEEEEKKKGTEKIFEGIIVETFPNMGKEIVNQVQEAQRVPYRKNPRRNTPRYI